MTRRPLRIIAFAVALIFFAVCVWALTHPSISDPKNIRYVLWKIGLPTLNQNIALGTMIGDSGRDKIVKGKTKAQLRNKFGYLLTPKEASPYLDRCYQDSSWKDKDVLFIGPTAWMVLFEGDRAVDLMLIKGC